MSHLLVLDILRCRRIFHPMHCIHRVCTSGFARCLAKDIHMYHSRLVQLDEVVEVVVVVAAVVVTMKE
jgi:hypothetical protein